MGFELGIHNKKWWETSNKPPNLLRFCIFPFSHLYVVSSLLHPHSHHEFSRRTHHPSRNATRNTARYTRTQHTTQHATHHATRNTQHAARILTHLTTSTTQHLHNIYTHLTTILHSHLTTFLNYLFNPLYSIPHFSMPFAECHHKIECLGQLQFSQV